MADLTNTELDDLPAAMRPSSGPWTPTNTELDDLPADMRPQLPQEPTARSLAVKNYLQAQEMERARQKLQGTQETTRSYLGRRIMLGGSALLEHRQAQEYAQASKRLEQGIPRPEDYDTIAGYEKVQQSDIEEGKSLGGIVKNLALRAPAFLGEAVAGGGAARGLGLAAEAGQTAKVAMPWLAAQKTGELGVRSLAMPAIYAKAWAEGNMKAGRDPTDFRGFPAAYGLALAQNAVFGAMGNVGGKAFQGAGAGNFLARKGVQAGVGLGAMQGADIMTSALSKIWPYAEALDTGYGTIGQILDGKYGDALRHAVGNALMFATFGAAHEIAEGTPAQRQARVAEQLAQNLKERARAGYSATAAGGGVAEIGDALARFLDDNPYPSRSKVQKFLQRITKEGSTARAYADALAQTFPEQGGAGGKPGGIGSPPPESFPPAEGVGGMPGGLPGDTMGPPVSGPPGGIGAAPRESFPPAEGSGGPPGAPPADNLGPPNAGPPGGIGSPPRPSYQPAEGPGGIPGGLPGGSPEAVPPEPAPRTYKELQQRGKELGLKAGGVKREVLEQRVKEKEAELAQQPAETPAEKPKREPGFLLPKKRRRGFLLGQEVSPEEPVEPPTVEPEPPRGEVEGPPLPDPEEQVLLRMRRAGLSDREIGRRLGRSNTDIGNKFRKIDPEGVYKPEKPGKPIEEVSVPPEELAESQVSRNLHDLTDEEIVDRIDDQLFHKQIVEEYRDAAAAARRSGETQSRIDEVSADSEAGGSGGTHPPAEGGGEASGAGAQSAPRRSWLEWLAERAKRFGGETKAEGEGFWPIRLVKELAGKVRQAFSKSGLKNKPVFEAREATTLEDLFEAAGLTPRERHILAERLKDRTHREIGQDQEVNLQGPAVYQNEQAALRKLGPYAEQVEAFSQKRVSERLEQLEQRARNGEATAEELQGLFGLTDNEMHVLRERFAGRAYADIGADWGMANGGRAHLAEQSAHKKLGEHLELAREILGGEEAPDSARRKAEIRAAQRRAEATGRLRERPAEIAARQARLAEVLARQEAGEVVSPQEVFTAAGLTQAEQYVLEQRLAGRRALDVGTDREMGVSHQKVKGLQEAALRKLGPLGDRLREQLGLEETGERQAALQAKGKGFQYADVGIDLTDLEKKDWTRNDLRDAIDAVMRRMGGAYVKEKQNAGGKLSAEREAAWTARLEHLDRAAKNPSAPAEREGGGARINGIDAIQAAREFLGGQPKSGRKFWSGQPYEPLIGGETGGIPIDVDAVAAKAREWWDKSSGYGKKLWDDFRSWLAVEGRSPESKIAGGSLRHRLAERSNQQANARAALEQARQHLERTIVNAPDEPTRRTRFLELTNALEGKTPIASLPEELRPMASAMRDLNEGRSKELADRDIVSNFIENYFPHLWENPHAVPQSFWKRRSIPTYEEGLAQGLKPISWNVADLALAGLEAKDRAIAYHDVAQDLKANGLAQWVGRHDRPPEGWVRDEMAMRFLKPRKQMATPEPEGYWYAPEPVVKLLQNHLSPGLQQNSLYQLARGWGNNLNNFQLGLGAFHAGFVATDTVVSGTALALQQASRGELGKAAGTLGRALGEPVNAYKRGKQLRQELDMPGSTGNSELRQLAEHFLESGGRKEQDQVYHAGALKAFKDAWTRMREGNPESAGSVLWHAMPAFVEWTSIPLMKYYVPRVKMGVWMQMARDQLSRMPDATLEQRRAVLGKAWDSVENRLGQLTYDNLFWNKSFKDVLMVGVRSVGWNVGTVRELAGGVKDIGSLGQIRGEGISPRLAYLVALPMTTALAAAVYQYLATGKGPEEAMDLVAPKTGGQRPDGVADRVQLPSYMRDLTHLFNRGTEGPGRWLSNLYDMGKGKLNPGLTTVAEMLENKDFFGKAIVNPADPYVQRSLDTAKHLFGTFEPLSSRTARQFLQEGKGVGGVVQGALGVSPAPSRVVHTAEQQREVEQGRRHEATPLEKRKQAEQNAGRPQEVNDYFARLHAVEFRRQASPERQKGLRFADETLYQRLNRFKAGMEQLEHLARGERRLGERWIAGTPPPAERVAQLRARQQELARRALELAKGS